MARVALVVDDSMLIRHTVCRFLEERGFVAESATNGREALDLLHAMTSPPDVVLTDLMMPLMAGGELITRIKAERRTAAIPIVLLVTKRSPYPPIEAKHAAYVIYKDIDIQEQLQKALTAAIGKAGTTKRGRAKPRRKTPRRRSRRTRT